MRKYGIYLAYPPTITLQAEGLGRHLAEFLKAAEERTDVCFVIACPSWMRESLIKFLEDAQVKSLHKIEFISPVGKPLFFRLYEWNCVVYRNKGWLSKGYSWCSDFFSSLRKHIEKKIVSIRSIISLVVWGLLILPFVVVWLVVQLVIKIFAVNWILKKTVSIFKRFTIIRALYERSSIIVVQLKKNSLVFRLYRLMEEAEVSLMQSLIKKRKDILAWYSPTAFWPHFNEIPGPKLMCVPDVVLTKVPIGFASVGGARVLYNFKQLEKAIEGADHFVTYSEEIKQRTLVQRYYVDPIAITVVPHGVNQIDQLIRISGTLDDEAATDALCRNHFNAALCKSVKNGYASIFGKGNIRFIFYASQIRANKNVLTLLKAYEFLMKRRYVGHKLILTGYPSDPIPEIGQFIEQSHLENDVLFLYKLTDQELAACYRLADLAVNPSLYEGGCPFTFTEALSVDTPVVMSRIAVTEEVITDPDLQALMFFDPYDWKDMAHRIEWALNNKNFLLEKQKPFYEQLAKRTWRQVVDEYIEILDRISTPVSSKKIEVINENAD